MAVQLRVFVSYQRGDDRQGADRFYEKLGGDCVSVFVDVHCVLPGEDFRAATHGAIASSDVVLVLISRHFDPRRLSNEDDYVRTEVLEGLRLYKLVVPVLIDAAIMPNPKNLPAELERFSYRNAAYVRSGPAFEQDMRRLTEGLHQALRRRGRSDLGAIRPKANQGMLVAAGIIDFLLLVGCGLWAFSVMRGSGVSTPAPFLLTFFWGVAAATVGGVIWYGLNLSRSEKWPLNGQPPPYSGGVNEPHGEAAAAWGVISHGTVAVEWIGLELRYGVEPVRDLLGIALAFLIGSVIGTLLSTTGTGLMATDCAAGSRIRTSPSSGRRSSSC